MARNKRSHGKWMDDKVAFYLVCSECNAVVSSNLDKIYLMRHNLNFCPNCGADMREGKDGKHSN